MSTVRLMIGGKVQGVGYRNWTQQLARQCGLKGFVRNRTNSTVEVVVTGDDPTMVEFIAACYRGPSSAQVSQIIQSEAADEGWSDFLLAS